MIVVKHKSCKPENILKEFPDAIIHNVTSKATDEFVKFSPFYPHGGIPVPFSPGYTAYSVESIWQGLKDYDSVGIDTNVFRNSTMSDLKRTTRKYGHIKGHRKGVRGTEHLDYLEARKAIYAPCYKWILENKLGYLVDKIRQESADRTVVLLDYNTNCDINDQSSPLSHAGLIKAYIDGNYPECPEEFQSTIPVHEKVEVNMDFAVGDRVSHPKFGNGTVISLDATKDRISVQFDSEGIKILALSIAKLEKE